MRALGNHVLWIAVLVVALIGCEALWSGFSKTGGLACGRETPCPSGQICNLSLQRCELPQLVDFGPAPPPCTAHRDCPSQVCDTYQSTCIPSERVIYANELLACPVDETADGSFARPVCPIDSALERLGGGRDTIRVLNTSSIIHALSIGIPGDVKLFGPGADPRAMAYKDGSSSALISIYSGNVLLDGFSVISDSTGGGVGGIYCSGGGQLTLRRNYISTVTNMAASSTATGVAAIGCSLSMDGNSVTGFNQIGVLAKSGLHSITNNFIYGNGVAGLFVDLGATGVYQFNTLVANGTSGQAYGGVICKSGIQLQDSIIYNNQQGANLTQIDPSCRLERIVVNTNEAPNTPGLLKSNVTFMASADVPYRLAEVNACCVDKASDSTTVRRDYFQTLRPQGGLNDIGAHEVIPSGR